MDVKENINLLQDIARHPWETARAGIVWRQIRHRIPGKAPVPFNVLDYGSGDLYQALCLAKRDSRIRIFALDLAYTEDVRNQLRPLLVGYNISLVQSVNDLPEEIVFSTVLLMDVLEHIPDDHAFLKDVGCLRYFNESTEYYITVPAWQYLFSGHDKFLGHYRRYSRKKLAMVCENAGLRPVRSGYFFVSLWKLRIIQLIFRGVLKSKDEVKSDLSSWKGSRWLAYLLSQLLVGDYFLCRWFSRIGLQLPGLSVYALCNRKP